MTWWFTRDEEHLWGNVATREEAIAAGTRDFDGEPFFVCQGKHFRNRCDIFDIDSIAERFDDLNEDYAGEENPSESWTTEHGQELESELNAVVKAWAERHGYHKAWGIDAEPSERIVPASVDERPQDQDPQGLEAKPASAVGAAETPNPYSHAEAKQPALSRTDAHAHPSGIRPTSSTGAE